MSTYALIRICSCVPELRMRPKVLRPAAAGYALRVLPRDAGAGLEGPHLEFPWLLLGNLRDQETT